MKEFLLHRYLGVFVIALILMYRLYKVIKMKNKMPMLLNRGALIVDVREASEFNMASNPNSINIPLKKVHLNLNKINKNKPVVVCCATGGRSAKAMVILKESGYEVYNGGSWNKTIIND
jgi:phage shock protein E